jgi:DNA invertase Pin-like site-specific DNA recombinase
MEGNGVLIGYARVSKLDGSQVVDLQIDALRAAGVEESRIYKDEVSGKNSTRPGLDACLKALQPGNTLVVWKLDRLGRDLKHLITIVDGLRNQGIGFKIKVLALRC